jgi:hypothetical protein
MRSVNKVLTVIIAAMAFAIAAPASARQTQAGGPSSPAPKLVVPLTSFEFGDVYRGEIISHTFVIRNEGGADLVIKEFTAACGCSVTESDRVIPPGKEGRAVLEIDTSTQAGEITKVATLRTNDLARPNLLLTLTANVLTSSDGGPVKGVTLRPGKHIGPLFVGPQTHWIVRLAPGQKARTEFTVSAERGPVKLLRVEGNSPQFVSRVETIEEGKLYRIVVEAGPVAGPGLHEDRLRVSTDSAALPAFHINLNLNVITSP